MSNSEYIKELDRRIQDVIQILECESLYGTVNLIKDLRNFIDIIRVDAIDECITKLLTESITCFSDVIAVLEQLKEKND